MILSVENSTFWSWGLHSEEVLGGLGHTIDHRSKLFDEKSFQNASVIVVQNLPQMQYVPKEFWNKTVLRLGGWVFTDGKPIKDYPDEITSVAAVIATNNMYAQWAKRYRENVDIIPAGVDLNLFRPFTNKIKNKKFQIGFAGNIWGTSLKYKGYHLLTKAVADMFAYAELKTAFSIYKQVPLMQMVDFYRGIDCLVLPSYGEGCSHTISEALACGIPVICTQVGFHGENLQTFKNCIFVERDVRDIANKISILHKYPELREKLAKAGREVAVKHHDLQKIREAYKAIILKVERGTNG